jgi:hypothetical protein
MLKENTTTTLLMFKTLLAFVFILNNKLFAQVPSIEWEKCYQTTAYESSRCVQSTNDGGYVFAGASNYLMGNSDAFIVKISSVGAVQWSTTLGDSGSDFAWKVEQTTDNGFIIIGQQFGGSSNGNHGLNDVLVIKLNNLGDLEWQKCFGGTKDDVGMDIHQTADGGYIFSGHTDSNDGDVNGLHEFPNNGWDEKDAWVVKLNNVGSIQWQKCLGGTGGEMGCSILETTDGGYVLGGVTSSNLNDGDVNGFIGGGNDGWLVKLDQNGDTIWQKCLGGIGSDLISSVSTTADGGYVFTGWTSSSDINGYHNGTTGVTSDVWIAKANNMGVLDWQKCFGGSNEDEGNSIKTTSDGGYIFSGWTGSFNGDVGFHYSDACWIIKLNNTGVVEWKKLLDGGGDDKGYDVQQTSDGGYIVSATVDDGGLDISDHKGGFDAWIIKLGYGASISNETQKNFSLFPNPSNGNQINLTYPESLIGRTYLIEDINGCKIFVGKISPNSEQIQINELKDGVYFLVIEGQGMPLKFIVNQ